MALLHEDARAGGADASGMGETRAGLARRLAVRDGSFAAARDLRRWVRDQGGAAPASLRRAAMVSWVLPPLGVSLALAAAGDPAVAAFPPPDLGEDVGVTGAVVITPSADQALAAVCAAALPAAQVTFVGGVRPTPELAAALGPRTPRRCSDLSSISPHLSACDRMSFHGLDGRALQEAAKTFDSVTRLDLNAPPSADLPAPATPACGEWTEAGLRAAVTAVETPVPTGAPGTFVRSPRRFTYGRGRSYFRLSAGADPAECVRVLDALVAMRHVWIVSVDPSHDPRLIERVARDAAFCEEQTEDVFGEFVTAGDRVRVIGKSMTEPPPDACFITGPLSDSPEAEIRHHYHRQLLRIGLPSVIPPDRLA